MGYVIARWWTFNKPFIALQDAVGLLQHLSGSEPSRLGTLVFDGRRNVSGSLDCVTAIHARSFPTRFCAADIRSRGARFGNHQNPRSFAATLDVSPLSRLWAKVTRRAPKNHRDHAEAMSFRSVESYGRLSGVRSMPHLVQGWVVPPRAKPRSEQVSDVLLWLIKRLQHVKRVPSVSGGVDFVTHFSEMGSYDLTSLLSSKPHQWEQLRTRFDDMHKIMFGAQRTFNGLSPAELRDTFERVDMISSKSVESVVAVARTKSSMRRFGRRASQLLVQ